MRWIDYNVWNVFRRCDWTNSEFQIEKSHFLCALSKLAYASIPELELIDTDRAKLIPCWDYQEAIRQGTRLSLQEVVSELDIPIVFEIQSRLTVSVGFKLGQVLFVSSRGTQDAYDWFINLDARKRSAQTLCGTRYEVHRGFHLAAAEIAEKIADHIVDKENIAKFERVVFCGHSLGGAISSNFFAHCEICSNDNWIIQSKKWNFVMSTVASEAYIFGAPRYIGECSHRIAEPFSIINHGDIVPTIPPTYIGYRDYNRVFDCAGRRLEEVYGDELRSAIGWLSSLATGTGVQNHSIEQYLTSYPSK
jgi:hypothetical protein